MFTHGNYIFCTAKNCSQLFSHADCCLCGGATCSLARTGIVTMNPHVLICMQQTVPLPAQNATAVGEYMASKPPWKTGFMSRYNIKCPPWLLDT